MTDPVSDERLAGIIDELTGKLRRGEQPDLEEASRRHPDLAGDLRELWGAVLVTEELARPRPAAPRTETLPPGLLPEEAPAARAAPLPGGFGDYQVLEELGRGGMGVVYKARQLSLGRTVALKTMLDSEASAANVARFRAEAESAAGLDHPHIVPVHEVGSSGGKPYFTMRYVEGTTLARRLAEGPLSPREAAGLLLPVARAVHYAHQRGVLHRDLKPSNILIDRDGLAHVSDFGLARRIEGDGGLTRTGAILGTPGYMAPEQAAGGRGRIGPATDVYGLGAVLYHMIAGRPPFQAASAVDTVLMVLEQDPLPPRFLDPRVDRDLEIIARKCLQKPVDLRYPSAGAVAEDLAAYLAGEPLSARSGGLRLLATRLLRETHHAAVLENWGRLWMWHSVALLALCGSTNLLQWRGVTRPEPYLAIWTVGFGAWAAIFWALRRRGGPITFVERQIAHVWGASVLASVFLFVVELVLRLPVLTLSPVLALVSGMVFFVKAGILSGTFYFQAGALFLTAVAMALFPRVGLILFGLVNATCFFIPGWKYHRQRARAATPEAPDGP